MIADMQFAAWRDDLVYTTQDGESSSIHRRHRSPPALRAQVLTLRNLGPEPQMEEAVRLVLALWTERRTTFHGRYFRAEDAILEPNPVQKPRPSVMIAGGGEQVTLRAVRLRTIAVRRLPSKSAR
jgi:alkanesulfonate monooxygenase SsuD/methylene tetrahydromethanopterin reductase-like flavin-dependent oxidoreductase (luciferase family)